MKPPDDLSSWLGDLTWQGYPRLEPVRDAVSSVENAPSPRPRKAGDARMEALARENEALRAKLDSLTGLAAEFERRLAQAAAAYEESALESEAAQRAADIEHERLLLQAKSLTDQDILLLRAEMREFLAKFHRIQESLPVVPQSPAAGPESLSGVSEPLPKITGLEP
ncbi:MAG: hypothetical protein HYZ74_01635 [Elusimicrobia bacterium]|nr:hypothetical protein [Elusimicrobiota bacterium]